MYEYLRDLRFYSAIIGRIFTASMEFLPTQTETITPRQNGSPREYRQLSPEQLVDLAIDTRIAHAEKHGAISGDESFFVVDLGEVSRQHQRWKRNLPDVQPYYGKLTISNQWREISERLILTSFLSC
jgi:ornithine decarboxylase